MIIKQVDETYLKHYATHLKQLSEQDKFTRFGYKVSDFNIDQFMLGILYSPESHVLFVAEDESKVVIGFSHLARYKDNEWELAVSVNSDRQNTGVGSHLMSYAISYAKVHDITSIFMHCINDNRRIQHLARKHGLKVMSKDGGDITAKLEVPNATLIEYASNLIQEQVDVSRKILELQSKWFQNISK